MKKMLVILIVSCLLLVSGCGSAPGEDIGSRSTDESVEIEKGLLDVTITLPASLVEEDNIEATIKEAKEKGVKEAVLNDDGSLTYKMSKSVYRELKQELKDNFNEMIEELKSDNDFPSIKDVQSNKDLTAMTLIVDKELYENSLDGFAILGLGTAALYYQLFDGVQAENIAVTINIKDSTTGELFETMVYPDDLEADK